MADIKKPASIIHNAHCDGAEITYEHNPAMFGNNSVDANNHPESLLTLLHGLGDTAGGWSEVAEYYTGRFPHNPLASEAGKLLFMLPTAPMQRVTCNMGERMHAWYDIIDMTTSGLGLKQFSRTGLVDRPVVVGGMRQDPKGLLTSAKYLFEHALYEAKRHHIFNTKKIVFTGFSQGAAVALVAALLAPYTCGGVVAMSGYIPAKDDVKKEFLAAKRAPVGISSPNASEKNFYDFPILLCHGNHDEVIPIEAMTATREWLTKDFGIPEGHIESKTYQFMTHSVCDGEMEDVGRWLKRALHPDNEAKI